MWNNLRVVASRARTFVQFVRHARMAPKESFVVTKPLLIYEAPKDQFRFYRRVGNLSLILAVVSGVVSYSSIKFYREISEKASKGNQLFSFTVPSLTVLIGFLAFGFGILYPCRGIRAITLYPQSRAVLNFYGMFGRFPNAMMQTSLHDIEVVGYKAGVMYLKILGRAFQYTVPCENATFHSHEHFNHIFSMNKRF